MNAITWCINEDKNKTYAIVKKLVLSILLHHSYITVEKARSHNVDPLYPANCHDNSRNFEQILIISLDIIISTTCIAIYVAGSNIKTTLKNYCKLFFTGLSIATAESFLKIYHGIMFYFTI